MVPGKRTEEKVHQLVQDFKGRTGGRLMNLLTSDEYPAYKTAIFEAYAVEQEVHTDGPSAGVRGSRRRCCPRG